MPACGRTSAGHTIRVVPDHRNVRFPKRIHLSPAAYADAHAVFHVTIHAHPEIPAFPDPVANGIWEVVLENVDADRVKLIAACLMRDHLHVLAMAGTVDVMTFVARFKAWTTRVAWGRGHRGPLWQPGSWDRTVRNDEDFRATVAYVVDNPMRAGLVEDGQAWPWVWTADVESLGALGNARRR